MNKGFWKGLIYGFVGTIPLYLMLNGSFWLLQTLGVIHPSEKNVPLFIGTYALVISIYMFLVIAYFRNKSSKNLEKLKREVEEITGKKLS